MNLVHLEQWPVEKPHGQAVTRIIHVSMEFEDGHIETASSVEEFDTSTQECCPGGGCNPLIDPLCT